MDIHPCILFNPDHNPEDTQHYFPTLQKEKLSLDMLSNLPENTKEEEGPCLDSKHLMVSISMRKPVKEYAGGMPVVP